MASRRIVVFTCGLLGVMCGVRWFSGMLLNARLIEVLQRKEPGAAAKVSALLRRGADPNAKGSKNLTALVWAAHSGDAAAVEALLEGGAEPNCRGGRGSALDKAARNGRLDIVELLLAHGADPNNGREGTGSWALVLAVENGHVPVARMLLQRGADPNSLDHVRASVLWRARHERMPQMVDVLDQAGAREILPETPQLSPTERRLPTGGPKGH